MTPETLGEARRCAHLCRLAMDSRVDWQTVVDDLDRAYTPQRLRALELLSSANAQALVVVIDQTAYCAWRGTERDDISDLLTDLNVRKVWVEALGGQVHRGFYGYFSRLAMLIDKWLDKHADGLDLIVTGHSLGAAAATIQHRLGRSHACYVFGSPRLGDADFARNYDRPLERFSVLGDPVTSVPSLIRWRHVGPVHVLSENGAHYSMRPSVYVWLTARNLALALIERRLIERVRHAWGRHAITYYIELLERLAPAPAPEPG